MPLIKRRRQALTTGLALFVAMSQGGSAQYKVEGLAELISASGTDKELPTPGLEKLDPRLRRLVRAAESGNAGAVAKSIGVPENNSLVSVTLSGIGESTEAIEQAVANAGGEMEAVQNGVVYARVPVSYLSNLASSKDLVYAGPQMEYHLLGQSSGGLGPTEGLVVSAIQTLHQRGIRGQKMKVGIIDGGYQQYDALVAAGRLPKPKGTLVQNRTNSFENGSEHGTGCAEIVHQLAPDAELYLAAVDLTAGPVLKAAQWMVSQGVQVINFSVGGTYRGDGKDDLSLIVEETVRKNGVLWLVAAGNEAEKHWSGSSGRVSANGFLLTAPNDGDSLKIVAQANWIQVTMHWNDWGSNPRVPSATQDLDMFLISQGVDGKRTIVEKAENAQGGQGAQPLEVIKVATQPGQVFYLAIRASRVNRNLLVHVFTHNAKVSPAIAEGSVGYPALARDAIAVGAVDVRTGKLASYSSQGPTDDGRVKPEIGAPAGTTSMAYAADPDHRFHGTSAAAPHATGFAVLVKQMNPNATVAQLRAILIRAVRPMGASAPNNQYGYGHIDASKLGVAPASSPGATPSRAGSITLPRGWGREVSQKAIERIRDGEGENAIDVKVVVGKQRYQIGDGMKIGYRASEDCYYLLLNRSTGGEFALVGPTANENPQLTGGERYTLPVGDETLRVTGPAGSEELILICSRKPIDLGTARRSDLSISVMRYEVIE